jgi:hypothetical protein
MAAFPSPGNVLVLPQAGGGANTLVLPQVYMPSAGFPIQPSDTPIPSNAPGIASQTSAAGGASILPGAGLSLAGFAAEAVPILLELLGPVFALLMQSQPKAAAPAPAIRRALPAAVAPAQHAPAAAPRTSPLLSPVMAL